MATADKRAKDVAMAAHLKEKGVDRTTARCPICNTVVHWNRDRGLYNHVAFHK